MPWSTNEDYCRPNTQFPKISCTILKDSCQFSTFHSSNDAYCFCCSAAMCFQMLELAPTESFEMQFHAWHGRCTAFGCGLPPPSPLPPKSRGKNSFGPQSEVVRATLPYSLLGRVKPR